MIAYWLTICAKLSINFLIWLLEIYLYQIYKATYQICPVIKHLLLSFSITSIYRQLFLHFFETFFVNLFFFTIIFYSSLWFLTMFILVQFFIKVYKPFKNFLTYLSFTICIYLFNLSSLFKVLINMNNIYCFLPYDQIRL